MSEHDADLTLRQIIEVCDKAIEFSHSITWEEFHGNWRRQMLGERLVEVFGVAVKITSWRLPSSGGSSWRGWPLPRWWFGRPREFFHPFA